MVKITSSPTHTGGTGSTGGVPSVYGGEAFQLHCHVGHHHALLLLHLRPHRPLCGHAGGWVGHCPRSGTMCSPGRFTGGWVGGWGIVPLRALTCFQARLRWFCLPSNHLLLSFLSG